MQKAFLSFRTLKELGVAEFASFPQENGVCFSTECGNADGVFLLFDLKEEQAGIFDVELEMSEETEILIGYGEHLNDLRIRTGVDGRQFSAVYKAKPGRQNFIWPFKRFGCRYVSLYIYSNSLKLYYS